MQTNQVRVNVPIFGILGIVFIVLKLTNVIDWSWWWVLAPFWMPIVAAISLWVIFFLAYLAFGRR